MGMTDGVKHWACAAVDTNAEIFHMLRAEGLDEKSAMIASAKIAKVEVAKMIDRHYANASASEITSGLRSVGAEGNSLH